MTYPSHLTLFNGLNYMIRGVKLLAYPGLKRFILIPLIANLVIFAVLSYFVVQFFDDINQWLLTFLPEWLSFLTHILWVLMVILFLLVYGYSFTLLTNLIAAPFYGMLSEKVETRLTGKAPTSEALHHMIPRMIGREIIKLCYFAGYGICVFLCLTLISFIPLVNVITPLLGALWSSWVMAIQYVDYPADNNQLSFKQLRQDLTTNKWGSISLGGFILLGSMIPIVNVLIAPAAVAAGTLYWVEELHHTNREKISAPLT